MARIAIQPAVHDHFVNLHFLSDCRRKFPAVSGGVIEDVRFLGNDRLIVGYYGGVTLFGTEVGASGMMLEYGVSAAAADGYGWGL